MLRGPLPASTTAAALHCIPPLKARVAGDAGLEFGAWDIDLASQASGPRVQGLLTFGVRSFEVQVFETFRGKIPQPNP